MPRNGNRRSPRVKKLLVEQIPVHLASRDSLSDFVARFSLFRPTKITFDREFRRAVIYFEKPSQSTEARSSLLKARTVMKFSLCWDKDRMALRITKAPHESTRTGLTVEQSESGQLDDNICKGVPPPSILSSCDCDVTKCGGASSEPARVEVAEVDISVDSRTKNQADNPPDKVDDIHIDKDSSSTLQETSQNTDPTRDFVKTFLLPRMLARLFHSVWDHCV